MRSIALVSLDIATSSIALVILLVPVILFIQRFISFIEAVANSTFQIEMLIRKPLFMGLDKLVGKIGYCGFKLLLGFAGHGSTRSYHVQKLALV